MTGVDEKEQAKIIRHFLLNSPPGQFSSVEKSLRTVVGTNEVIDRALPQIAKRYNETQLLSATVPGSDTKLVISKTGAVGDGGEYYEPSTNTVITFDHIKKEVTGKRDANPDEITHAQAEPYRSAVEIAFRQHVEGFYPDGFSVVYGSMGADGVTITAHLSATKVNLPNRWSGRVRATYTVTFNPGEAQAFIQGNFVVLVHYFEEGNVQLNSINKPELSCQALDPQALANTFVASIATWEHSFHSGVEKSFAEMSDGTFKSLRRKLPITGQKFDFDNWASYTIGSEMNAGQ